MAGEMPPWKQPVGGKMVTWRPLKVGDRMDLDGNYSRSDIAYLKKYAEYAFRIVTVEGMTTKFQPNDFREWDDFDLEAFAEEVSMQEMLRAQRLSGENGGSPVPRLERAIEASQAAAIELGRALQGVLAAAKALENQTGPLQPKAPNS